MNGPVHDSAMLVLMALATGEQVRPAADGEALELTVENGAVPADRETFDRLEELAWVVIGPDGVRVTERGNYWLQKWLRKLGVRMTPGTRIAAKVVGAK